jgi:murein DD-endopeptidase MepM/ murein hydrolase activator NlpD
VSGSAKHRKSSGRAPRPGSARHRKPSPISSALSNTPGQVAAVAAGAVLIGAAVTPAVAGLVNPNSHPSNNPDPAAALRQPGTTGSDIRSGSGASHGGAGSSASDLRQPASNLPAIKRHAQRVAIQRASRKHRQHSHATVTVYANPLRSISGLIPERVDMGVDFGGAGPIYAIGDGVVTQATGASAGWPGGGWITYQLTDGPAAGEVVYVAEDVRPTVTVGERVTPDTVVADMFDGGSGIETGWAMLDSASAESQLAEAGGISGGGPFPTLVGLNFDQMLVGLGVPAAPDAGYTGSGLLPSRYPVDWATALSAR